jgi:hypothetical protein
MIQRRNRRRLDFEVDKLTNSIENVLTGEIFETEIVQLRNENIPNLREEKWAFDWVFELNQSNCQVFALTIKGGSSVYHGLISLTDKGDHIFMNLLESAPFNKGREKRYSGVAANLVAFACMKSVELGYNGLVVFESKTRLMEHYEKTLKAQRFVLNRMFIDTREAYILIKRYFPDFTNDRF